VRTTEYGPEAAVRPWPRPPAAVLAIPIALFQVVGSHFASEGQPDRMPLDALGIALLLLGPAALLLRRRHPVPVLAVVMAATVAYLLAGYPYGPVFLSLVVAFFSAVVGGHRTGAWVVAGIGYAGYLALSSLPGGEPAPSWQHASLIAAWLLAVLAVAEVVRARRESFAEAARTRAEEARRKAGEERLRIARELHDVLAHNISLINVQAGVALHLIDEQPDQARTALAAIKQASKEALGELRSVLDILRHGDEGAPRAPAPGLAQLDELVARASAAGIPVRTTVSGTPQALPAGVDLAAYRIVQEALTNVVRHAGPARAAVTLSYADDGLTVQVDDDGRAATPASPATGGRGIAGMRERVAALGGRLEAGPRPEGGFRVLAWLPLDGDS
jgi:signal transduction histidine kinase